MKALVVDFSRVLIFPKASGVGSLNQHHRQLSGSPDYHLFDHFEMNHELLSYLKYMSHRVPIYIFTTGKLLEHPEIKPHLGSTFTSAFLAPVVGPKNIPGTYQKIAGSLGLAPNEITFIDDQPENVQAASAAGMKARLYGSNAETILQLIALFGVIKDLNTVVDEHDNIIEYKHRGDITHDDIYRISSLWLNDSRGRILLAQRSFTKDKGPGQWGPAAAGTVEAGESYEVNMYKEAEEEIGLSGISFTLGPKKFTDNGERKYFAQWYSATLDQEIGDFVLQAEEVEQIEWVEAAELIRDIDLHPDKFTPSAAKFWGEFINNRA